MPLACFLSHTPRFKSIFILLSVLLLTNSDTTQARDSLDWIPELMTETGIPGLSLAQIRDGQLEQAVVYGLANQDSGEQVTENTLFEAASLSKPVFAWIVLKLVERGELDLDQPLHELLPNPRFGQADEARALTARLILSHQSGLPNWGGDVLPFNFEPGSRFGYSGEGYVYLQHVVEKLTGLSLEALAQREVFGPLGMTHSHFDNSSQPGVTISAGHNALGRPQSRGLGDANAAASLHTTATDYARFMLAVLNAEGLAAESVQQMLSSQIRMQGDERGNKNPKTIAGRVGWALGWGTQHGDEDLLWHWGDNGVFRAFVVLRPSDKSGLVYFTNSSNGLAIGRRMMKRLFADMSITFDWLMYAQSDNPGWHTRRQAAMAEARGELEKARSLYQDVVKRVPEDENSARRIEWLGDLIQIQSRPYQLQPEVLETYHGQYGPRKVFIGPEGQLQYRRGENTAYDLIPLKPHWFALKGMTDFRIEFQVEVEGGASRIIGHYINGHQDESERTD